MTIRQTHSQWVAQLNRTLSHRRVSFRHSVIKSLFVTVPISPIQAIFGMFAHQITDFVHEIKETCPKAQDVSDKPHSFLLLGNCHSQRDEAFGSGSQLTEVLRRKTLLVSGGAESCCVCSPC